MIFKVGRAVGNSIQTPGLAVCFLDQKYQLFTTSPNIWSTKLQSQYLYLSDSVLIPFFSPTGKKFRSKPQLSRYLGNSVDLGCFDFRTGKMMPGKMQKNKQRFRHYDPHSLAKVTLMDYICGELLLESLNKAAPDSLCRLTHLSNHWMYCLEILKKVSWVLENGRSAHSFTTEEDGNE